MRSAPAIASAARSTTLMVEGPLFFCREDEDHFFGWILGIPHVLGVKGIGREIEVQVRRPVSRASLLALGGLLTRYRIDPAPLRPLCSMRNEAWFEGRMTTWNRHR